MASYKMIGWPSFMVYKIHFNAISIETSAMYLNIFVFVFYLIFMNFNTITNKQHSFMGTYINIFSTKYNTKSKINFGLVNWFRYKQIFVSMYRLIFVVKYSYA